MPTVSVGVPLVPSRNGFEHIEIVFGYDAGDDECLLTMEWIWVSKFNAEDAE